MLKGGISLWEMNQAFAALSSLARAFPPGELLGTRNLQIPRSLCISLAGKLNGTRDHHVK
jgi:hypothetical protein